jgi:hypothetical protein
MFVVAPNTLYWSFVKVQIDLFFLLLSDINALKNKQLHKRKQTH